MRKRDESHILVRLAGAHAANAHDFILDLPQGYETRVGQNGVKLSGDGTREQLVAGCPEYADAYYRWEVEDEKMPGGSFPDKTVCAASGTAYDAPT